MNWLSSYEFLGAIALLMLGLAIFRVWRNPAMMALDKELVVDWMSVPATTASPVFRQNFHSMNIPQENDIHLLRIAFVNRGRLPLGEEDFVGRISIILPEEADILAARSDGTVADAQPEVWRNRVSQPPCPLSPGGWLSVFLLVRGAAEPENVAGGLKGQSGLRRVRLKFRI